MQDTLIKWHDRESAGLFDFLPGALFETNETRSGATHPVVDRSGRKVADAKCDVTFGANFAELDYRPYRPFNEEREMLLGVLRVIFDTKRTRIEGARWKPKGADHFDDDQPTIEPIVSAAPDGGSASETRSPVAGQDFKYRFNVGQTYTRRDLRRVIGLDPSTAGGKVDTGYFEHGGAFFILCGIGTAGRTGHDYNNRLEGDHLFWSGKTRAKLHHASIRRMISADAEVHVFHRSDDRNPFTYAGRGKAIATKDVVPVEITWHLGAGSAVQAKDADGGDAEEDVAPPEQKPSDSVRSDTYFAPAPKGVAPKQTSVPATPAKIDHAARDARNRNLGRAGERFVVELERKRLSEQQRPDLAQRIEWVADTAGDGLGYDVRSFNAQTGEPLMIEVKTTNGPAGNPFYVTRREIDTSAANAKWFRLYRVFNYSKSPQIYVVEGALEDGFSLTATVYAARCK